MKRSFAIFISILIFIITIVQVLQTNESKIIDFPVAKQGVIDYRHWDFNNKDTVQLIGEWEFYPGRFIEPNTPQRGLEPFEEFSHIRKLVQVPGSWESYLSDDGSVEGAGTYRLLIHVPEEGMYAIKPGTIRFANRIYWNGKQVSTVGNPALTKEEFIAGSQSKLGIGESYNHMIELVFHVSSYSYDTGGIIHAVSFGSLEGIMRQRDVQRTIDAFLISGNLILGLYFLAIFLQWKDDKYFFYFSFMCIFQAVYLSTLNEQLLNLVFQNYHIMFRTRVQIVAVVLITICFLKCVHYFFQGISNRKIIRGITSILVLVLILFLDDPFNSRHFLSISIGTAQRMMVVVTMLSYCYIFWILGKALYRRVKASQYIIIVITSLFSYWALMSCKVLLEIEMGNVPVFLFGVMMIGIALMMNYRHQLEYQQIQSLSEKLLTYDQLKDEFLAKTSHELKTPLHIILNLSRFLLEGQEGPLNQHQQQSLLFINREGQRLTRLVEDLLDASRIKEQEVRLFIQPTAPYYLVEEILAEMKVLLPQARNLELKNEIPQNFPPLLVDPDRFRQIIYNLVHNAIKYTETGTISVTGEVKDHKAEIKVIDTGVGIELKAQEAIFTTFYQGNHQGTKNSEGLGLGLVIVKHLVEIQDGVIWVESAPGEGSSFIFTLPIASESFFKSSQVGLKDPYIYKQKDALYQQEEMPREVEVLGEYTILVVDDEIVNRKIMITLMNQMGHRVLSADSGKRALELLGEEKIDLMILDLMMPDMTGDQVCQKVREQYSITELPILILTAAGRTLDLLNAFQCGANDFQKKPADADELKARVKSLLLIKKSAEEAKWRELKYFQSQISPHFLYNTLNTIIGLSYRDSEKTREALQNLSTYFRAKLELHLQNDFITLEEELELVKAYLEIEQMRYNDRLQVQYDIDKTAKAHLPSLTLQPLVENAVRHGIAVRDQGGSIIISVRKRESKRVCVIIKDDGPGMSFEKQRELLQGGNGQIGFANVLKKITLIQGASIELDSHEGEGTCITILLPEVKEYESNADR